MKALIIIFIVCAILIGGACATVVVIDFINEIKEKRKKNQETVVIANENQKVEEEIVKPTIVEQKEKVEVKDESVLDNENNVAFSMMQQTLEEKYFELESEYKKYFDEIVKFAMSIEGSKRYKNTSYEDYKVGKNRLVRVRIKRGIIVCELTLPNPAFKDYINNNKVAIKQAPAVIKVTDEASLSVVKESMNLIIKSIEEEKELKKEQAKLKRKKQKEENVKQEEVSFKETA